MKLTAKLGVYTSVVGQSIMLHDETGRVMCQLAMLNIGAEGHKQKSDKIGQFVVDKINSSQPSPERVAYKIKDSRGEYWQTRVNGQPYNFSPSPEFTPTRWVDTREREPTVGGTYFTGKWVGPTNGLRQFRRKLLYCIIHEDVGLRWYDFRRDRLGNQQVAFPHCWLEGMPGAPPDDGR